MQGVLLPGLDTRPPYTLAVLPLPPTVPAAEPVLSAVGQLPGCSGGGGSSPCTSPGAVRYEIHVTARQLEAVFTADPGH
jgi:hypothetical protein